MSRGGAVLDLSGLRPRARAVLRVLAVSVGEGVHRHVLCDELWPEDDEAAATRKLHVAISSIRRVVELDGVEVVRRDGELYLLDATLRCDVRRLRGGPGVRPLGAGSRRHRGGRNGVAPGARAATPAASCPRTSRASGSRRKRRQLQAMSAEAARQLAELLLEQDDRSGAIEVCRTGIAVDRYADPLWRLLLRGLAADGDLAGHARARAQYDAVLTELGIDH